MSCNERLLVYIMIELPSRTTGDPGKQHIRGLSDDKRRPRVGDRSPAPIWGLGEHTKVTDEL